MSPDLDETGRITDESSELVTSTGEAAIEVLADDLFFDIPEEELAKFEHKKSHSDNTARPLFLPSSSDPVVQPSYRDSASADIDWAPSEDENSSLPIRPPSSSRTRSVPSSVITISDSEEESNASPPPTKKRKQTPLVTKGSSTAQTSANASAAVVRLRSASHKPLDCAALYVGEVVVEAWSTVKGKGHLRPGELLQLERDASASGTTGKTTSKSAATSVAALTAAAKKKVKEDAIVRVVNSRGSGMYFVLSGRGCF
jgi:DNA repair protein RAD5